MIVVADTSPFVVLVAIGHVDVLSTLFKEVLIPPPVASELASPKRSQEVREFITAPPPWLRVVGPASIETIPGLGAGETAAIALAAEVQAGRLIIDEYRGRKAATVRGLRVVRTVGVLELAAEIGLIDLAKACESNRPTSGSATSCSMSDSPSSFSASRPHDAGGLGVLRWHAERPGGHRRSRRGPGAGT
jgi:predicted nucleic acid-binding protein